MVKVGKFVPKEVGCTKCYKYAHVKNYMDQSRIRHLFHCFKNKISGYNEDRDDNDY